MATGRFPLLGRLSTPLNTIGAVCIKRFGKVAFDYAHATLPNNPQLVANLLQEMYIVRHKKNSSVKSSQALCECLS